VSEVGVARTGARPALAQLREAAGRVVGSVFYGTMLKMMRESSLKSPIGHGGRGEEAFAGQLDGIWAERLGEASHRGLSEVLYQHLEKQQRRMDGMISDGKGTGT
jgi:Rod binding domain-containing protein